MCPCISQSMKCFLKAHCRKWIAMQLWRCWHSAISLHQLQALSTSLLYGCKCRDHNSQIGFLNIEVSCMTIFELRDELYDKTCPCARCKHAWSNALSRREKCGIAACSPPPLSLHSTFPAATPLPTQSRIQQLCCPELKTPWGCTRSQIYLKRSPPSLLVFEEQSVPDGNPVKPPEACVIL